MDLVRLLWPQRPLFFFLIKRTKNQVTSAMLLCAQGLYAAKPGSTTGCLDLRLGFARTSLSFMQI